MPGTILIGAGLQQGISKALSLCSFQVFVVCRQYTRQISEMASMSVIHEEEQQGREGSWETPGLIWCGYFRVSGEGPLKSWLLGKYPKRAKDIAMKVYRGGAF